MYAGPITPTQHVLFPDSDLPGSNVCRFTRFVTLTQHPVTSLDFISHGAALVWTILQPVLLFKRGVIHVMSNEHDRLSCVSAHLPLTNSRQPTPQNSR
jgi:hypothetical protein